jgi:serine/threonine protein kinase/tetratricopeptide (TPR) repeat protein
MIVATADQLIDLFNEAKAKPAGAERDRFLAQACGNDSQLKRQVLSLLQAEADEGDSGFLKRTPLLRWTALVTEKPGDRIGRYKLLQQLGEGGCGVVYMAEQEEPVRRRVALKVIKLGMDTKSVIARFEAERQALALMDHPNIAKVLDAGATDTGRPFFVMELVRGIKITDYCDQNNLSTEQRLELFVQVCHAVQHAHQKGIIHRDLKPSNILVTLHDGVPVPKVIDFGVAKATSDQRLTDKTVFTAFEQFIGTPAYMSPEQAEMSGLDIDTRSDIYSLGVLLYELLTGGTPLDAGELLRSGMSEMRRKIRETEPPRPSTRLSTMHAADLTTIAKHRQAEAPRLIHLVRGDLDWIVMKCLEKDRARRYETANGLAADIERYVSSEPIAARPPSGFYRLQKMVRRNKAAFTAAAAIAVMLIVGVVVSTWQAVRATTEKRRADEQAAIATSITKYLQQMLGSIAPSSGKSFDYTVRQLLDDYAADLEKQLPKHPEVEAALQTTLGESYAVLGERDKAQKHLTRALELRRSAFGENHEKYAESLVECAQPNANPPNVLAAREVDLRRALSIYRARGVGGGPVIRALRVLAWNLTSQSRDWGAEKWNDVDLVAREALMEARKFPGTNFTEMASVLQYWASSKLARGDYAEAEGLLREALAIDLKLRPDHPEKGWRYFVLADALRKQKKFVEALQADKEFLAIVQKALPGNKVVAFGLNAVLSTLELAESSHVLSELFPSAADLAELESSFHHVLTSTKPGTLDDEDPVLVALHGLARFNKFYVHIADEFVSAGKLKEADEARRKATQVLENLQKELADKPDLLAEFQRYQAQLLKTDK